MKWGFLLILIFLLPNTSHAALTSGLVSYWKMDESSGNAADSVASNTLTNNNSCVYAAGKINNAVSFISASTQTLSITDASQVGLGISGNFAVSFWFKATSAIGSGSYWVILSKFKGTGNQRAYRIAYQFTGASKEIQLGTSTNGGDTPNLVQTTITQDLGTTWHHVVLSGSSGTFTTYIDGSSIGTMANNSSIFSTSNAAFRIGGDDDGNLGDFSIDEVGFWNRSLTSGEVTQLYNGGSGVQYPFVNPYVTSKFIVNNATILLNKATLIIP